MVLFDLESVYFDASLKMFPVPIEQGLRTALGQIHGQMSWGAFSVAFDFQEFPVAPIDSFVGTEPYYCFVVALDIAQPNGRAARHKVLVIGRRSGDVFDCAAAYLEP
jgi:hypothetical protein